MSINIQRGRDLGLTNYADYRHQIFGEKIKWDDITRDSRLKDKLASIYTSVDKCDPIIGIFSEDHVKGSLGGKTFTKLLSDSFSTLVSGDRCFHTHISHKNILHKEIKNLKLSHLIYANTEIHPRSMQETCFHV
jgi:hypothetical protein